MRQLSNYQKAKIVVGIINDLKEIKNKTHFYIDFEDDGIMSKISKKTGIPLGRNHEAGMVDISEYIQITFDIREYRLIREQHSPNHSIFRRPDPKFYDDEFKDKIKLFEDKNIPSSGPCETLIGELFRAIQRIQYRAFNDGDDFCDVGSPSFMSYMFLISQIDELNYSSTSYNEEKGQHEFEFTNKFIKENSWDGKISTVIEHSLAKDADFIKAQLIDLLENNKLKDIPNEWDSRDYSKLDKGNRW
jgi:hypothetical protein